MNEESESIAESITTGTLEDALIRVSWSGGGPTWAPIAPGSITANKITVGTMPYVIDADSVPHAVIVIKQNGKEVLRVNAAQLAQLGAALEALASARELEE